MRYSRLILLALLILYALEAYPQSTGTIQISNLTGTNFVKPVSGNRRIVNGFGLPADDFIFALLDQNYQEIWSIGIYVPEYATLKDAIELNDGSFVLLFVDPYHDGNLASVVKLSATGQILFRQIYHFAAQEFRCTSLAPAPPGDNGFIMGGGHLVYQGPLADAQNYLVKCDGAGQVQWANAYSSPGLASGDVMDIITDWTGYRMLTAGSNTTDTDVWISHVDPLGVADWSQRLLSPVQDDFPYQFKELSSGGYAIMCRRYDSTLVGALIYVSPNFGQAQLRYYEYTSSYFPVGMDITTDDHVVVVGHVQYNNQYMQLGIYQTDTSGQITWSKQSLVTSGAHYSAGYHVSRLPNGRLVIPNFAPTTGTESYITEIDAAGAGFCNEGPFAIIPSTATQMTVMATTMTASPLSVTMTVEHDSIHAPSSFTMQNVCGSVVGLTPKNVPAEISLSPNPGQDRLSISIPAGFRGYTIRVYNAEGAMLYMQQNTAGQSCEIDMSTFPSGLYMIECSTPTKRSVGKWMKR